MSFLPKMALIFMGSFGREMINRSILVMSHELMYHNMTALSISLSYNSQNWMRCTLGLVEI